MSTIASAARSQVLRRNNVTVTGDPAGRPIVFAHGFGCSQEVWHAVAPRFESDHRVVLFDAVGSGASDLGAYDPARYDSLHGYADDLLEILDALDLHDAVFVGHSVAAMVGVLASNVDPSRFGALVLVGPSPRYLDDDDYTGGFSHADIEGLLDALDANYLGWSETMAPLIMGNPARPELGSDLTESFCSVDPRIASQFARVTFLSDNRRDLEQVRTPTLVLQCSEDVIAPPAVGRYVHEQISGSRFVQLAATGHCPNLSAPEELAAEITAFLR
ncbi:MULTISPECIES: alpha/beta fold hydrolase [unclassified Agromyces]|jgi:sigma-B regulation protein RsbQ|uniref:alpha/beta fold hydrolase n=1 Tax=unclassified Agromyces TaxID=2639701 RepID=UPI0007B1EE16|nr:MULTISPECIES: alpha/beta hydrolase [unclassified Agromyces]KZE92335.1 Sigma factor SigB regulation protein RsbQ [Agromyces sp. NDB4Y10]MCK8609616.1 alpha/beta hydrolase [Agromyces sp. C10]